MWSLLLLIGAVASALWVTWRVAQAPEEERVGLILHYMTIGGATYVAYVAVIGVLWFLVGAAMLIAG